MKDKNKVHIEAAAFRRLIKHFRERSDVQNIDLMNMAGFCRNCLSKWYQEASEDLGEKLSKEDARKIIYGMPYDEWRNKFQFEASQDQINKFKSHPKN